MLNCRRHGGRRTAFAWNKSSLILIPNMVHYTHKLNLGDIPTVTMVYPHHSAPEHLSDVRGIPFNFRGIAAIDMAPCSQLPPLTSAPERSSSPPLPDHRRSRPR